MTKLRHYHVFGLNIESEFPFLDIPEISGSPDVKIRCGPVPNEIAGASFHGVRYQAAPGKFLLRVDHVARFYVTGGSTITVERHPDAVDEEVLLFLMGSAMGALLHQRNILPLHGSAIEASGGGTVFLGPSSSGKSTLAAGLQRRGYPILADDVCAVNALGGGVPEILPGFPRLKLWGDSLKWLDEDKLTLKRVRRDQSFDKFFIPFQQARRAPVPVKRVFILKHSNKPGFTLSELRGGDKLDPLIENTYRPRFLESLGNKEHHFLQCLAVANASRVFEVTRPRKGFHLNELMALVEEQF